MNFGKPRLRLAPLLLSALALGVWAAPAPQTPDGWDLLLNGKPPAEAEAAFKARLDADRSDAAAAAGLVLVSRVMGEREQAVVVGTEALLNAPGSPLSFLFEEVLSDEATFDRTTTSLVTDAIPRIVRADGLDPMVRFSLRWQLFNLAARMGDAAGRRAALTGAGFVPAAYFSKPETELSRLAFYDVEAPEKGDLGAKDWSFSTLDNPVVRPPLPDMSGEESNYLALVPFSVASGGEAMIYVNASRSFRLYLDDRLLLTKDVFKVQENPTVLHRVRLGPGSHRILLKIHASQPGDGVHLALLDGRGDPLGAEWASAPEPPEGRTAGFEDLGEARQAFAASFPSGDPRRPGLEAMWNRWLGDVAKGRVMMEEASESAPGMVVWNCLAAKMYLFESDDLPDKIAQSRAEQCVDRALKVSPDCPEALFFKALLQGENSDGNENLASLQDLTEKVPSDTRWFIALAQQLMSRGWMTQARKVLEAASSYHPDCEDVESGWVAFFRQSRDARAEEAAIGRLARLRNADPEWEDYYGRMGRWDDLLTLWDRLSKDFGDRDRQYLFQTARLMMRLGRYAEARERLARLVAVNPKAPDLSLYLARACFLMGDEAAGRAAWAALKKAKPDAFQVDLAEIYLGKPLPFQDKHLDLAQVLEQDAAKGPDEAPSSLVLDQMLTRVEPDGSSLERYHGILRINDKEGVDREGEQEIPGQILLSLKTVKPDGTVLEPEQIPDKSTVSVQGLEPGDLVEYEYVTLKPPSPVKKNAYLTSQVFLFQDIDKPFHRTQWYLEYPKAMPMQFLEKNLPSPAAKGETDQTLWRDWDYRNMPRIPPEPDTPNKMLFTPQVEAVGGITWRDVALQMKDGLTGTCQVTPEVERQYEAAVGGAKGPAQVLDALVAYLMKAVDGEGGGWQDPTQVLLTRQGSRLPVLCAFLTLAKIPYEILVAEAVPDRDYREDLPRLGQFRYPVVKVALPGGPRYLTLQSPYRDPSILPWYLQGASALDITVERPWEKTTLPQDPSSWASALETETRELQPDGDMSATYSALLDPDASEGMRGGLARVPVDQRKRAIQMSLAKRYGSVDLVDFDLTPLEDVSRPLRFSYTLRVNGYASADGQSLTVADPLPALGLREAMASLETRTLPLATGGPIHVRQRFTFVLPAGASTDYAPRDVTLKSEFGAYSLKVSTTAGRVEITRSLDVDYQIVWPAHYAAFRNFLDRIDAAEAGQLVVRLGSGEGGPAA